MDSVVFREKVFDGDDDHPIQFVLRVVPRKCGRRFAKQLLQIPSISCAKAELLASRWPTAAQMVDDLDARGRARAEAVLCVEGGDS